MKTGQIIHGFRIDSITEVAEIKAVAYQMTHVRTLAKLLWLKRDDDNKTFSIAFKTIPHDDTGVFHILEHSVLNGSEKYPLKEPFVNLLKGSLQTFLNAMTFPDMTAYPVASRNSQDFYNLMRVYLDAVFHPLCIKNENIFRQEGWHYELESRDSQPLYKGVVYNEMKGAYSSPERLASETVMHNMFPDNCYRYSSGGDPDRIPDLTYQQFCQTHHYFYNATNSRIFLDGDMDIDTVLGIIDDEYLSQMEIVETDTAIAHQQPVRVPLQVKEFDATSLQDKTIIDYGYVIGDFNYYEKVVAFKVLASLLSGDNQSKLKKAVLDSGLAQDINMSVEDGVYQPYVEIAVTNTNPESYEKLDAIITETLTNAVKDGLDRKEMEAVISSMEFSAKERDFGYAPKGVIYDIQALSSWNYDGNPIDGLVVDHLFKSLREKLNTSYYEELLDKYILHSEHCASVLAKPVIGLEEDKGKKMAEQMAEYKASLKPEQLDELLKFNEQFVLWQKTPDSKETEAMLPSLSLKDIDENAQHIAREVKDKDGITVISYPDSTDGINYYSMYFDVDDLSLQQLQDLSLLSSLLTHLNTRKHEVTEYNRLKKLYLGSLSFGLLGFENSKNGDYSTKLAVRFSCLDQYRNEALKLVEETMHESILTDRQIVLDMLRQAKNDMEMEFVYGGHQLGLTRAMAFASRKATCREYTSGYQFYDYLKQQTENFSDELLQRLQNLCDRLFTSSRLTVSLMGENQQEMTEKLIASVKHDDEKPAKNLWQPMSKEKCAIAIASMVSYGEMAAQMKTDLRTVRGQMAVIRKVLSLDYLWTTIRAMGGAYGSGFVSNGVNAVAYYSYRDPNPANSLTAYRKTADYLKQFCASDSDLEPYIIGTIGDVDPLLTNKTRITIGDEEYFTETTDQDKQEMRKQILQMDKQQIEQLSSMFEFADEDVAVCVVGPKEAISNCGQQVEKVYDL